MFRLINALRPWAVLFKSVTDSWLADRAPSIGAAYTVFSLAPTLLLVIAVAGFAFGRQTAEGALLGELSSLVGGELVNLA